MRDILFVWDIDGTLIHCGSCGREALNDTFRELFNVGNAFKHAKLGGKTDSVVLEEIFRQYNISEEKKPLILETYGIALKKSLDSYKNNRVLPGIKNILEFSKTNKNIYNTIATSNFEIGARIKLDVHGLNPYFLTGGFGDTAKEKWQSAIQAVKDTEKLYEIEFEKENIYIIGDTWYDIECAKKLGVKSIAVATGWVSYEDLKACDSDFLFKDLENYQSILNIICNDW